MLFPTNEKGQGCVEYALMILGLAVIVVILYNFILVPISNLPPITFPKSY